MRISVIGASGAGKSTLARRLSADLDLRHVELDAINWGPGWRGLQAEDPEEFLRQVVRATAGERWVSDGNYGDALRVLLGRATHLIWLDYERSVIMPRVIRRSILRAAGGKELWPGTGNREDFRRWLQKDHPIRWAWDTFQRRRLQYAALFDEPALAHIARHRLRHPREAPALIAQLAVG